MNYEILNIKTAQKIAEIEKENKKLKEEIKQKSDEITLLKDRLYKLTTKFN
jgi:predicted nuclease with TOPRIM domain